MEDTSSSPLSYALFETEIGLCAIIWGRIGVRGVQLPEANAVAAQARINRRFPGAQKSDPSPDITKAIDAMCALLRGEAIDVEHIALDMTAISPFNARVFALARQIPPGQTKTYGEIAKALGLAEAARAVGQAMSENPFPIIVPCHRVLAAGGKTGGFSAPGGVNTKLRMLTIERARTAVNAVEPELFAYLPLAAKPRTPFSVKAGNRRP